MVMRKIIKWTAIILAGIIGVLLIAAGALFISGSSRLNKTYDIEPEAVALSRDAQAVERGKYLVSFNCTGCHGPDLAGTLFFDDPAIGKIPASNLTAGQGGIGATYTDADFVRAIRHGVNSSGKPLLIMPSEAFWHYSDQDLAAIIAYIKSVPPVDADLGQKEYPPLGRILFAAGALGDLAVDVIDHETRPPTAADQGVSAAYGEYLVNISNCRLCHGSSLSGGKDPDPSAPPGPNLTPGGELASWTANDFLTAIHTGMTPSDRKLNPEFMPWNDFSHMSDDDLTAVFLYLQSLPAQETTTK